jgi:hypothetical protein
MRVQITDIGKGSNLYQFREFLIGQFGEINDLEKWNSGWYYTYEGFFPDNILDLPGWCFAKEGNIPISELKYIEVPEPSAMSELAPKYSTDIELAGKLASWLNDGIETSRSKCVVEEKPAPKKLTWIQNIQKYDKDIDLLNRQVAMFSGLAGDNKKAYDVAREKNNDLCARVQSAEAMRDHYKTQLESWESLAISKARELELMEKVADLWQQRLIDQNETIGKRLKFSVGHNHITITIGNPVTLCENFISNNGKLEWSISRCSRKDVYDWKQGVIYAVDNYCDEHKSAEKLRRDLRKALAKKYPEVFTK